MIGGDENQKIKAEIVDKVNYVLEKNGESFRMDGVNVLTLLCKNSPASLSRG